MVWFFVCGVFGVCGVCGVCGVGGFVCGDALPDKEGTCSPYVNTYLHLHYQHHHSSPQETQHSDN